MGCIIKPTGKPEVYYTKREMWKRILELGKKEAKRKKSLKVYAHHHQYDFYAYADLFDKEIKWYSERPFIVERNNIKFLDTMAIYKMSLQKLGQLIGLHKQETPEKLKTGQPLNSKEYKQTETYMIRDAQIVMEATKWIKNKLAKDGIRPKTLYTINQIAITHMIKKLKEDTEKTTKKAVMTLPTKSGELATKVIKQNEIFWDFDKGQTWKPNNKHKIHAAYRGGKVEAWQTGTYQNTTYLDINNLYGHAATKMQMPNLATEKIEYKPLENNKSINQILRKTGLTRCLIQNKNNNIGLLQTRLPDSNYYPQPKTYQIGTWTNQELKLALQEGYRIWDIEFTINYKNTHNPFKKIMKELYQKRQDSTNEYDKYYYKMLQNAALGKFGQTRTGQELIIDDIERINEYQKKGYKAITGIDKKGKGYYMYQGTPEKTKWKAYYAPIIPTLVNAQARTIMYKHYKKIPKEHLLYTDTDSILHTGKTPKNIKISQKMGDFKKEHENQTATIYARKTYSIGNKLVLAGINKKDITPQQLQTGIIETRRMNTIKNSPTQEQIGTFTTETRNLHEQNKRHKTAKKLLQKQKIYIDTDINLIRHFTPVIQRITQWEQEKTK